MSFRRENMLSENIKRLVQYGIDAGLTPECERIYTTNLLLELFHEDDYEEVEVNGEKELEEILGELLDEACSRGIIENSVVYRDLFDTKMMNCLMPRPAQVQETFWKKYEESPEAATDYYYKLSQDSDYIRRYRVKKDWKWTVDSPYGEIDITINLSKPEKDPKAIAAAKNAKASSYPKCLLCVENEGYAGRVNHPARENHRIMPITVNDSAWGFQYSPYVYYNEHCIVFNGKHTPMKIEKETFMKLFDFVKLFPHYFLGSNADLPIVGGSILSHDHFQGGHYTFAMAKAPIEKHFEVKGFEDVESGIVKWPLSVIRLRSKDEKRLIELGTHILNAWRGYTDEEAFVFAETDGEPHNTITPIARKVGEIYELDLTLRNNITTEEHPLGLYHPHAEYHNIKKENIGLIEVMGLAVLPSRLKQELETLAEYIVEGKDISENEMIEKHTKWVEKFLPKYDTITKENVMDILKEEVGIVFTKVLEDAGVYKCTEEGRTAFARFLNTL
jgi:UDPglucose--hexose-1-phosphate uridylyltransferase